MELEARTAPSVGAVRRRATSVPGVITAAGRGMTVNQTMTSVPLLRFTE